MTESEGQIVFVKEDRNVVEHHQLDEITKMNIEKVTGKE